MIISRLLFGISIVTIYPIILLLGRWVKPETICVVWVYVLTTDMCSRCPCAEQICHPELGAAHSKTPSRDCYSCVWETLQNHFHCDLDHCHSSHRHVCPRHGWSHQCHRRNQRLLHLYFPWYVNILNLCVSVCNIWTCFYFRCLHDVYLFYCFCSFNHLWIIVNLICMQSAISLLLYYCHAHQVNLAIWCIYVLQGYA